MFSPSQFLPAAVIERITATRVAEPGFLAHAANQRERREHLAPTGRLNLLAADHPARGVTRVGANPLAMADRHQYLARILRVLAAPNIDGIMATMDILEDLFLVDGLLRAAGGVPLLDGKLAIASINRGGLAGSAWELDDPATGPSVAACRKRGLDGVKLLLRVDEREPASLKTMRDCARVISEAAQHELPVFLEPLPVTRTDQGWTVTRKAGALARLAGVASALGDSSAQLWLKLPYCDGFDTVARSTTLPVLLLGGESAGDVAPFLAELRAGMDAGRNVRGALVGRNVLFPGDEDPLAAAEAAGRIIHQNATVEQAVQSYASNRGRDLERIAGPLTAGDTA